MSATPVSRSAVSLNQPLSVGSTRGLSRLDQISIGNANAGDHGAIYELLVTAGAAPSREDFLASHDNPHYEPSDRLLVWDGSRLVGHLQVSRRVMQLAGVPLPVALLQSLAVLPEYSSEGYVSRLLETAQRQLQEDGTVLALVETRWPERYQQAGWTACGRQSFYRAGAREIRAHLSEQSSPRQPRRPLSTRIWRHVELRQLSQLYGAATQGTTGPLERTEDYWHWLISRQAYDQILVAIEGNDTLEFGEQAPHIVGYAVTSEARVVEIIAQDQRPDILRQLLVRACREAIECDHHTLRVQVPAGHAVAQLLTGAGDSRAASLEHGAEVTMARLIDPLALVNRLSPLLLERARQAGIDRPWEFTLALDEVGYRFTLSRRSAKLTPEETGRRAEVSLPTELFTALLLGQTDVEQARQQGLLKTKNKSQALALDSLFPRLSWWRPVFDDLSG